MVTEVVIVMWSSCHSKVNGQILLRSQEHWLFPNSVSHLQSQGGDKVINLLLITVIMFYED